MDRENTQYTDLTEVTAPKPGYKTSELYVIIGGMLLSVAVGGGWLSNDQAQAISEATGQTATAITHLVTVMAPVAAAIAYTWSRTRIKS